MGWMMKGIVWHACYSWNSSRLFTPDISQYRRSLPYWKVSSLMVIVERRSVALLPKIRHSKKYTIAMREIVVSDVAAQSQPGLCLLWRSRTCTEARGIVEKETPQIVFYALFVLLILVNVTWRANVYLGRRFVNSAVSQLSLRKKLHFVYFVPIYIYLCWTSKRV